MESSNPPIQTIDLNNINEKQAIFVIWQLLNKAQTRGVFSIDEACAAKAAITKLDKINSTSDVTSNN
tara:strand:- start:441 stop:641 length:201 start_codon:yes stop_codon:yes gene_type:complete